jgi:hypothetical protein
MSVIHIQEKIKMKGVTGGNHNEQSALMDIFFLGTGVNDTYQLFTLNGQLIETSPPVVATGVVFTFTLRGMPGIVWTIKGFEIDHDHASGLWSNPLHGPEADDGSFQATSGPAVEDAVASATA